MRLVLSGSENNTHRKNIGPILSNFRNKALVRGVFTGIYNKNSEYYVSVSNFYYVLAKILIKQI